MLTVKTHTFRAGAVLPVFKTAGAAGADIRAFLKDIEKDHPIWNYIQKDKRISTGRTTICKPCEVQRTTLRNNRRSP